MGLDIKSKLMIGLDYKDLTDVVGEEMIDDLIEMGELDYASPYYDSRAIHWFVGTELMNGATIDDNVVITAEEIKGITNALDELLGVKLTYRLRGCAHVY